MKKQIVFIHGGNAYSTYDAFLDDLRTKTIWDPYGLEDSKRWKDTLREEFYPEYDVLYPQMPNKQNAHYEEWKIWFERYFEYLTREIILIGHSLGGYFLAKYLSENEVPFPVLSLCLVAAPFCPSQIGGEDGGDFVFNIENLSRIEKNIENIAIFHSSDDPVVHFSDAEKYANALPGAKLYRFSNRGHFLCSDFPELIKEIRGLA